MSADWFLARGGQQRVGPLTAQQLKQMAAAGQVTGNDLVWKEGMAQWVPASQVKGLVGGSTGSQAWQSEAVAPAPAPAPAVEAAPMIFEEPAGAVVSRGGGEPAYYLNLERYSKPYLWVGLAAAGLIFLYGAYSTLSLFSMASGMGYLWVTVSFFIVVALTGTFVGGLFLAVWLIQVAVDMGRSLRSINRKIGKS
jgi:hypothetical protein